MKEFIQFVVSKEGNSGANRAYRPAPCFIAIAIANPTVASILLDLTYLYLSSVQFMYLQY
jgi:hypothetical protein